MALKSLRDHNRIVVGLVSLTVLALAVTGAFLIGTLGLLEGGYTVTGVFADSGGLRSGDDVRVAGVRAGKVTKVRAEHARGEVLITWKVNDGVRLGSQTRAEIEMANVLGGRYLRLAGPVGAPYLNELPAKRRRIPAERTSTPVTVNDALKDTTRAVSGLDTKAIAKLLDELGGINDRDRGRAAHALKNLTALAETVNEANPQIRELLTNGERVMSLASAKDGQLSRLLTNIRALLAELRLRRAELTTVLGSGNSAVQNLSRLISGHQNELASLMSDLDSTLRTVGPRLGDLNHTLAWAGPTMTGLSGIGGYGPWVEAVLTGLGPLSPKDLAGLVAPKAPGGRR